MHISSRIHSRITSIVVAILTSATILLAAFAFHSTPAIAQSNQERITNFEVRIDLHESNKAIIKERITYDFTNRGEHHGIFRHVPIQYRNAQNDYVAHPIHLESILDAAGNAYQFEENIEDGSIVWKIGDPDKEITGTHIYEITYSLEAPVIYTANGTPTFSWNLTGSQWNVPIEKVSGTLQLAPEPSKLQAGQLNCYTGAQQSTEQTCSIQFNQSNSEVTFVAARPLQAGEGMTIDVALDAEDVAPFAVFTIATDPTAHITIDDNQIGRAQAQSIALSQGQHILRASRWTYAPQTLTLNAEPGAQVTLQIDLEKPFYWQLIQVGIPVALALAYLWWAVRSFYRYGREPKTSQVIVTEFDVPENLTPLQVGAIMDQRVSHKEIAAEIVHLAERGYLIIRRDEESGLTAKLKKPSYTFIKKKEMSPEDPSLSSEDQKLFAALFRSGDKSRNEVSMKELQEGFATSVQGVKRATYATLVKKNIFTKAPQHQRMKYLTLALITLVGGVVGFAAFDAAPAWLLVCVVGAIGVALSQGMGQRTTHGAQTYRKLQGYKKYLEVAEKDRIAFFNDPKKYQELFERVLPYAMVFGIEKQWAKHFESLQQSGQNPSWYQGHGAFVPVLFVSEMSSFSQSIQTAGYTNSSSTGGGGFSGGGFGGGGGGSW